LKDSNTQARISSVLEKILQHPAAHPESQAEESREAFEEARVRSRDSFALEMRFADGRRAGFSYAYLMETDFDFSDSGDTITLRFGRADVVVTGRALMGLYEKLVDQMTRIIKEGTSAEDE
jgi:hypothetical protein